MKYIKKMMGLFFMAVLVFVAMDVVIAYGANSTEEMTDVTVGCEVINRSMAVVSTVVFVIIGIIAFVKRNWKRN